MNLLPSNYSYFRSPEYWRHFYSNLDNFEWYVNFHDIEAAFYKILYEKSRLAEFYNVDSLISYEQVLNRSDFYKENVDFSNITIINIGTGNSLLPLELQKANFKRVISIDFEQSVIEAMKKYENEVLKWQCVDVSTSDYLNLSNQLDNDSVKILLDKAFLDAYISHDSGESVEMIKDKAKLYLKNSISLLNVGDIFIIISLLQPYIIKEIIRNMFGENILIDVYPIVNSIIPSNNGLKLIPYVIAIYKIDYQIENKYRCRIYGISGVPSQHFSIFNLLKVVNEIQFSYYTFSIAKNFNPGKMIIFHVDSSNSDISYSLMIYDTKAFNSIVKKSKDSLKSAVVIVPPGYEQSHLFSTIEGKDKLANSSNCDRLIIVSFNWLNCAILQYDYQKLLKKVKSDLNQLFLRLSTNDDIPIMTFEDDNRIKSFVAKIPSMQSYTILIRDLLTTESNTFSRQLIFTSSPHTVQSELCYQWVDGVEHFLFDRPCLEHHIAICMPIINSISNIDSKIAILGSGVNVLSNLLNHLLKNNICYHCIDIDHEVINLSGKYFGNDLSNFTKLSDELFHSKFDGNIVNIHGDVMKYINMAIKYCKNSFGAIILDINNSDEDKCGINSPNIHCISDNFLTNVSQLLTETGLFIVNVITTHSDANNIIVTALKRHFKHIKAITIPEIVNKVFVCSNFGLDDNLIGDSIEKLNKQLKITFIVDEWSILDY